MQQYEPIPQAQEADPLAPVRLPPYADREISKAKDDYTRAVASGQFDEIQLEELWNKTDNHVNRLMNASAEDRHVPEKAALQQQFDENVLDFQGKLIQQDPQTGMFDVLSEPVKDARLMEEMQFQQRLDLQKGRIDLMKQLGGLATGTAERGKKPMYTPEQIRQEVDRMLPETDSQNRNGSGSEGLSPEQFDQQWDQLPVGGTLVGPDGNTYRKQ